MPYAHKYANAVTEHGIVGALRSFLPEEGAIGALIRGGVSVARKDVEGLAGLLIDSEMKMFRGLNTPVIFLQNVVTDLILGLGAKSVFRVFADHVRIKYGAEPGFITMNLPALLDAPGRMWDRQSDRLCEHQQDRFPDVRRPQAICRSDRDAAIPANCDVRPCVWRHPAAEAIEFICDQPRIRVDRVRRFEPRQHCPDQKVDRYLNQFQIGIVADDGKALSDQMLAAVPSA